MSEATSIIFPVKSGKLLSNLDAAGFQIENLDTSNLDLTPGTGNDTGTTTAILKGDGNHGFADAVADTDYASVALVATKENSADHDTDIATLTTALALKADTADVTAALDVKADASALTTGLATKEPLLPTTLNDGYILARHDSLGGDEWYFVDPVSLGTTNQSFVDGESFSDTNWDSASAQFNSGDIGKVITASNIPGATTIVSITSPTRVVLSDATLSTASGLSFTIFNRLTVAGGGGTVTHVTLTTSGGLYTAPDGLFSSLSTVANPTTSAAIGLLPSNQIPARTFYGNATAALGSATFMNQASALTNLGATPVGRNILQISGAGIQSWVSIDASGNVTAQNANNTRALMGAENVLTFNSPLARAINTISVPAATGTISGGVASGTTPGHLTAADWADFKNKPPNTRTISTTAPLQISGITPVANTYTADLSANRTFLMPRATISVDGYLAQTDFQFFANGSGQTVQISSGPITISSTANPRITRIQITSTLNARLDITLPLAGVYSSTVNFPFLEIVDISANGHSANGFGIRLIAQSGTPNNNTIDGSTQIDLPLGVGYVRLNSDTSRLWTTTKYYVDSFRDVLDPTKKIQVSFSNWTQTPPANTTRAVRVSPLADSVTVVPVTSAGDTSSFIYDFDASGNALRASPGSGVPDTTGHEGQVLTVVSNSAAWAGSTSPYQVLTPTILDGSNANITWACTPGQQRQNAIVTLTRATNNLLITGQQVGMHFSLYCYQDSGGSRALVPPSGSATNKADGTGGAGVLPDLSTTASALDHVEGDYVGSSTPALPYAFSVTQKNMTRAAIATCNVANTVTPANTGTIVFPLWTAAQPTGFVYVSNLYTAQENSTVCRVDVNAFRVGNPNFALDCSIYADTFQLDLSDGVTVGTDRITSATAGWVSATHLGCRITCSTITGGSAYIGAVVSTNEVSLVTTRGGSTAATTTSGTGLTVRTFGLPNSSVILGTNTNSLTSFVIPQFATAAGATAAGFPGASNADENPLTFTGFNFSQTAGTDYHMVFHQGGTSDSLNYVNLLQATSTTAGFSTKRSATAAPPQTWVNLGARRVRLRTYRAS